jgi:hypothetical protein
MQMRAIAIALSTLLIGASPLNSIGAQAATTQGYSAAPVLATTRIPSDTIQLAAGNKAGDHYLAGRAGGRYGVGGTERRPPKKKK